MSDRDCSRLLRIGCNPGSDVRRGVLCQDASPASREHEEGAMNRPQLRRPRRRIVLGAAALVAAFVGGGIAVAATAQPAIKTTTPRVERQMTNIDVLRQQIRNYYGDPL